MKEFESFYEEFLGLDWPRRPVVPCCNRDILLYNTLISPIIAVFWKNQLAISCSPSYSESLQILLADKYMNKSGFSWLVTPIQNILANMSTPLSIQKFIRMSYAGKITPQQECNARVLTASDRNILLDSFNTNTKLKKVETVWSYYSRLIEEGRVFGLLANNTIVSLSSISDIVCGGGNLTVSTQSKFQNKGFGKIVLASATKWCIDNDVLPIYWVNKKNILSIRLALSIGYQPEIEEVVFSYRVD